MNRYDWLILLFVWLSILTMVGGLVAFGELINRANWLFFLTAVLVLIPMLVTLLISEGRLISRFVHKSSEVRRNAKKKKSDTTTTTSTEPR